MSISSVLSAAKRAEADRTGRDCRPSGRTDWPNNSLRSTREAGATIDRLAEYKHWLGDEGEHQRKATEILGKLGRQEAAVKLVVTQAKVLMGGTNLSFEKRALALI